LTFPRKTSSGFKANLTPAEFVAAVMDGLKNDVPEIGYGMTAGLAKASREELDERFRQMNSRW